MKVDYLVVGFGLAGLSFVEQLEQNNKSYLVFNDHSQAATKTAAGVYNPTNLKRYTAVWNAVEHLKVLPHFFDKIENRLGISIRSEIPIYRRFSSIEEQNNWVVASDKPKLAPFLSTDFISNPFQYLNTNQDLGKVLQTGRIDTQLLVSEYISFLMRKHLVISEPFVHKKIVFDSDDAISYESISAKTIVFCEGYGLKKNPFFNYLPLQGNKGEYLIIESVDLKVDVILKAGLFIVPLGNDRYKVGATFDREDKTNAITDRSKNKIVEKLSKVIACPFKIVNHVAGIRPTTKDRKPFLGRHPQYKQLAVFNGFGSRGILMAPALSAQLYNYLEKGDSLDSEVDIARYSID